MRWERDGTFHTECCCNQSPFQNTEFKAAGRKKQTHSASAYIQISDVEDVTLGEITISVLNPRLRWRDCIDEFVELIEVNNPDRRV